MTRTSPRPGRWPHLSLLVLLTLGSWVGPASAQSGKIYRVDSNSYSALPLHEYDIASNTWTTRANLPSSNTTSIASDLQDVYVLPEDGQIYRYDPGGNTFVLVMPGPAAAAGRHNISFFETLNGEFYWGDDGTTTFHYTSNGSWLSATSPGSISSGSDVDRANNLVYVRIYSDLGFFAFDPATATFPVNCVLGGSVGENSRVGAYWNNFFYTRTWSGNLQETNVGNCSSVDTGVPLLTSHSSTAVADGFIFLNGFSGTQGTFEVYDITTPGVTTLASAPVYPGNAHPSLAFVREGVTLVQVDTTPTQVAPGQNGITVTVDARNDSPSEDALVTTLDLTFTGQADRTSEYTVTPDPGNPTQIAQGGGTATFTFTVDVSPSATEELITLDATFTGTLSPSGSPISATGAQTPDTWEVMGARPECRTVDAVPPMVGQGSSGHVVTVTVENVGLFDWVPGTFTLSFTGQADRTGEYTVTPDPGNPVLVAVGATETFSFTVSVSPSASLETITIDVAQCDGTDAVTGRTQSDSGADVTDTWQVVTCASTLCGDCDGDTVVTILDALLAAQNSALVITLAGTPFTNCNVIGDLEPLPSAVVDILDALTLAQFAASVPVTLNCC